MDAPDQYRPYDPPSPTSRQVMQGLMIRKERTFWLCQVFGWTGYLMLRSLNGAINQEEDFVGYLSWILASTCVGLVISTGLRYVYRVIRSWPLVGALTVAVILCSLLGLIFSSIELSLVQYLWTAGPQFEGLRRFANAMFETTVLLAWTSIYFGYHYYLGFQEEKERALKATAMAHQAQLMMLRYQLNPHFLFNTLNAISTLVLEKATAEANEMITKLSAFLRSSLVNQPTQKVSLDQEIGTLQLYLDIEKVRFQDRLTVVQDIQDEARSAMIPSLLLQPLIENAIKYAVAPSEDGGTITLCAEVDPMAKRLVVTLKDDGPGIPDIDHIRSQSGSGVGIANTKERLEQLYGAAHDITLINAQPKGLEVRISMPLERDMGIRTW